MAEAAPDVVISPRFRWLRGHLSQQVTARRTVNLPASAYEGSNPSPSTNDLAKYFGFLSGVNVAKPRFVPHMSLVFS